MTKKKNPPHAGGREGRDRRRELLRRRTLRCPRCKQAWLVTDAPGADSHTCKECGQSFAAGRGRKAV